LAVTRGETLTRAIAVSLLAVLLAGAAPAPLGGLSKPRELSEAERAAVGMVAAGPALAQAPPAVQVSPRCAAPEYRQFDFWVGDWDAFDLDGPKDAPDKPAKPIARNHVTPMLDGCALREIYEQADGLVGESFSVYDATRKVWHQSWVTNRGQLLVIEGRFENGRMTLSGTQTVDGRPQTLRGIWYLDQGGVRETAESSADGGKTWKPVFDIVFRPHKG
jgi:hypothetical protein